MALSIYQARTLVRTMSEDQMRTALLEMCLLCPGKSEQIIKAGIEAHPLELDMITIDNDGIESE